MIRANPGRNPQSPTSDPSFRPVVTLGQCEIPFLRPSSSISDSCGRLAVGSTQRPPKFGVVLSAILQCPSAYWLYRRLIACHPRGRAATPHVSPLLLYRRISDRPCCHLHQRDIALRNYRISASSSLPMGPIGVQLGIIFTKRKSKKYETSYKKRLRS